MWDWEKEGWERKTSKRESIGSRIREDALIQRRRKIKRERERESTEIKR